MIDLTNAPTVLEYVKEHDYSRLWLCPSIVSNGKISNPPWMYGYECTQNTIPDEIKNKKVRRHYKENNVDCIIWENDDDKPFCK